MGKLFGTDGIRGIAGQTLTAELAFHVGQAVAAVLTEEKGSRPLITIGKDTRISSDMLEAALMAGICSVGGDVMPLGTIPTPAVAFLTVQQQADAGIVISASHNPYAYNGIKVFNAPGLNGNAVAELTICKMLELSRHTIPAHRDVTVNQKWDKYAFVGRELRGKTLGVLGFGRIGQRVGEIARVFGMKVVAYDPYLPAEIFTKNEATSMSIAEVCEVADFVTIHMPLNDETRNLFNATSIAEMKSDAVVLNMARGGIVNEKDMYEALKAGKIGGYATDVLENEVAGDGLTEDSRFYSPLFDLDNFVVSPHIGAQTVDASRDIGQHIIAKVKEALNLG